MNFIIPAFLNLTMSYQAKIKRYLQILQLIEKQKFPTISEMLNNISEAGIKISDRQLKRDLESLRYEFGVDIQYSFGKRGYFVQNEDLTFPYFLKLLEFSQSIDLLTSYLKDGSAIAEIIEFEDYNSFRGLQYIRDLAYAIQSQSEISIEYKRFGSETTKNYCFQPYLLREYMNRWYVIGHLSESNEIRTFGLDRIMGLTNTGLKFKRIKKNDVSRLFPNVIGINASEQDKVEEIELVCQSFQGNLLKSLPLHASQKVIKETDNEIAFLYHLVVNLELKQRLLMISTQAKVTKPLNLKTEMEAMIAEAIDFYKK